ADELTHPTDWHYAVSEIRRRIDELQFVVSFVFDSIDPKLFHDVLVPAVGGISVDAAEYFIRAFDDAHSFEFVEYAPSGDRASAEIVKRLVGLVVDA
ncbi:MAG: arginase family protein, partial [Alphaproteobacteria bacterium]|nr:arginase family protein [Alphaproteobacteria bacterium]